MNVANDVINQSLNTPIICFTNEKIIRINNAQNTY